MESERKRMKRVLMVAVAVGAMLSAAGAEEEYISVVTGKPVPKDGKYTVEQIKARDERVLRKTGGFIHQAAEGPQTLLVDARAKSTLTLDEVARVYKLATHLDAQVRKEARGDATPLAFAKRVMSETKPLMLIMVVDGVPDQPILSIFPEERVGIVNADKLKGGDDSSAPELRVSKETWRAIGFVGGLGFSQADNDIMQPLYSLKELDANRYPFIQPMNMARMQKMWKRFGVKKERRIPYRVAVQEGWAAQPTNEYQKAVWDQVHQLPSEPIKIKPETKKVTE